MLAHERQKRCPGAKPTYVVALDQSPRFKSPLPVVSGGSPIAVWCPTAMQALSGLVHCNDESVASVLPMYSGCGANARVGTVIAVNVQEDSVVALANVKHSGGLFEKLVPASSRHYARLAAETVRAR
ncbi:hypothetical protein GGD62_005722 [Bradyrhizobium sp. ERR14]|nr:hypothetical protein [Bradyrhizobium sp. ERR14]